MWPLSNDTGVFTRIRPTINQTRQGSAVSNTIYPISKHIAERFRSSCSSLTFVRPSRPHDPFQLAIFVLGSNETTRCHLYLADTPAVYIHPRRTNGPGACVLPPTLSLSPTLIIPTTEPPALSVLHALASRAWRV